MGMFLTKYSMLNALGYGAEQNVLHETKRILDRFKLFGLVLHDPKVHYDFNECFAKSFERLDYITGKDFLFFGLTDPPKKWLQKDYRDYYKIWEIDHLFGPSNSYSTNDESITTYTIAQSLGIDYEDLPVIILTNNFQLNQFQVVKTCTNHLEKQMQEIGYFCSQKDKYFSLNDDDEFKLLVKSIDKCGGSFTLSNEESLAKTLSDFLAFVVSENRDSNDRRAAEIQMGNVISKFVSSKDHLRDPKRIEQLNLFLLGCLSNLKRYNQNDTNLILDEACENESKIILKTFNKVYPFFEPIKSELNHFQHKAEMEHRQYRNHRFSDSNELDYSTLILSLCKIFEIETNLSLVHWVRNNLKIEMPKYFKKHKDDTLTYTITPTEHIIANGRPIDFNKGYREKWIAPGIGESELAIKSLYGENKFPKEITNYENLFDNWAIIRQFRNKATHTESLNRNHFQTVFNAFKNLQDTNKFAEFNTLKSTLNH